MPKMIRKEMGDIKVAKINVNEFTKEQIEKAMQCETAEELMALAKAEGIELTKDEAEAYMAELADVELDSETLAKVAGGRKGGGGGCYGKCQARACDALARCVSES